MRKLANLQQIASNVANATDYVSHLPSKLLPNNPTVQTGENIGRTVLNAATLPRMASVAGLAANSSPVGWAATGFNALNQGAHLLAHDAGKYSYPAFKSEMQQSYGSPLNTFAHRALTYGSGFPVYSPVYTVQAASRGIGNAAQNLAHALRYRPGMHPGNVAKGAAMQIGRAHV